MKVSEFQKLAAEIVDKIDNKFRIKRDVQLNVSQLIEELGKLAKIVNSKRLRNKKPGRKDLEDEFADVFLQLAKLANSFDVELEKAVLDKIEVLEKRYGLK